MRASVKALVLFAWVTGAGTFVPMVLADGCSIQDEKEAGAQLSRAEDLERAGKSREAYEKAVTVPVECVSGGQKRFVALKHRAGKTLGGQEEEKGQLDKSFDWYSHTGLDADADRVKMMQVKARSGDISIFGSAYDYFKHRESEPALKELRTLAAKNADKMLAEEDRAFVAHMSSFDELEKAGDWLRYLGDNQMKRKTERAEQRGDTLATKDGSHMLEKAIRYYEVAGKPQKVHQVKDKALRLAEGYARTGETTSAANFYRLAGAESKASDIEKHAEQSKQQKEPKRQEQFKQDQDALEKELGF